MTPNPPIAPAATGISPSLLPPPVAAALSSTRNRHTLRAAAATALALVLVLLWDGAGLDLPAARLFGGAGGFALRDSWLLGDVLHDGARRALWVVAMVLCAGVWWPVGPLRRLDRGARLQMAVSTLAALAAVSLVKNLSRTSCPWDLHEFGGVAHYVSHWALGVWDGGPGRCFPAGHASAGFAFLGGWFAMRRTLPRAAAVWLAAALALGFFLGGVQQLRGAHFMSHTLWTAWLCWLTCWAVDELFSRWTALRSVTGLSQAPATP